MNFHEDEIELAQLMHSIGFEWEPQVGNYVYDLENMIKKPSPFQEHVYFILRLGEFLKIAGDIEQLQQNMCWLPTWEDARAMLKQWGVCPDDIKQRLIDEDAFEKGNERLILYKMMFEILKQKYVP